MKKTISLILFFGSLLFSYSQETDQKLKEADAIKVFTASNGMSYKVGDLIQLGLPKSNKKSPLYTSVKIRPDDINTASLNSGLVLRVTKIKQWKNKTILVCRAEEKLQIRHFRFDIDIEEAIKNSEVSLPIDLIEYEKKQKTISYLIKAGKNYNASMVTGIVTVIGGCVLSFIPVVPAAIAVGAVGTIVSTSFFFNGGANLIKAGKKLEKETLIR